MPHLHHNRLHVHLTPLLLVAFILIAVTIAGVVSGLSGTSGRFAILGQALIKTPFSHQKAVTNAATATPVDVQKPSGKPADAALLGNDTAADVQSQQEAIHSDLSKRDFTEKPVQANHRTGIYSFN